MGLVYDLPWDGAHQRKRNLSNEEAQRDCDCGNGGANNEAEGVS